MTDQISWSVVDDGIEDFERFLERVEVKSSDMTEPMTDSRDYVQSIIFEEFISEGGRSGGWEPLDDRYELWKVGRGQYDMLRLNPKLLHGDSGTPRGTEMYDVLLDDGSWTITPDDAVFAPDSTRAAWHQEGAIRRRGRLPARPWLAFEPQDYEEIEQIFENWLAETLSPEGFITPFFGLGYKRYLEGFI